MDRLRDRFWIWGHPAGSHDNEWGMTGMHSRMTPAEGAYYLGVRNALMICYRNKPQPPFDQETMALDPLREVIWSVVGDSASSNNTETLGYLDEIVRIAKDHPNIKGAIFDDFFCAGRENFYTPPVLNKMRNVLHNAPGGKLDMWAVVYDYQLDTDIQKHVDEFDGITFWTWKQEDLQNFQQNLEKIRRIANGKKLLLGCYLYDYGAAREMSVENMALQLEWYAEAVRSGKADGVILLSNTVADLGFEAVEYARKWLAEHGDEEL